jgi:ADP-heptose:LPS heptosyltransferase
MSSKPPDNRWIRHRVVGYLRGRGFTFGIENLFPREATAPGKFAVNCDSQKAPLVAVCDEGFGVLADGAFDWAFLGPRTNNHHDPEGLLKQASEKLKIGGHLLIHISDEELEQDDLTSFVGRWGSWQAKDRYLRNGQHVQIFKKIQGAKGVAPAKPRAPKRACIARYGAIGDMVILSPLIRQLAEDGYEVTLNITEYAEAVVKHNPHVSNIIIQERDAIPNPELGEYWKEWEQDYERYINLSESIEGRYLKVEGRPEFYTPREWRHSTCNVNYFDATMGIGGYPEATGRRGEFYLTAKERRDAQRFREKYSDKFLILWALNGSSYHKCYPLIEPTLNEWLASHPEARVVLLGDGRAKDLVFQHPQVIDGVEQFTLRQVMALVEVANLVIGPESAVINFAGCTDTPKICLLSHSTRENLTKYWVNDYSLEPVSPCYPCHQLHYSRETCPLINILDSDNQPIEPAIPVCTVGISPSRLIAQLDHIYSCTR